MTLHDHGYLPPEFLKSYPQFRSEIFKYTPCLGVWLSSGDFWGSIVMQISFVMLIFLLFSIVLKPIVFGEGQIA